MFEREGPARFSVYIKSGARGLSQIITDYSDTGIAQHIARPGNVVGGHGHSARQSFEHDQSECIRTAWENKDVGSRVNLRQLFAVQLAQVNGLWKFSSECRARGPVTDDNLRAARIGAEKILDIFLVSQAADVKKDRTRKIEIYSFRRIEVMRIHAPSPEARVRESTALEFFQNGICRNEYIR